jgi:Tol biopolymer transport system component
MRVLLRRRFSSIGPSPFGSWPTWSPAGDRIAYVTDLALFTVDTLGQVTQVMRQIPGVAGSGLPYWGVDGGYAPQFSLDRQSIFFTANSNGSQREVWRVGTNGSFPEQVSERAPWGVEANGSPHPTQALVAYESNRQALNGQGPTIRFVRLPARTVLPPVAVGVSPRWSPRGDVLAYLDLADRLRGLRPDGSDAGFVAGGARLQRGFNWSPDGRWIVGVGQAGMSMVSVETGEVLPLVYGGPEGTTLVQPSWRP